MAVVVEEVEGCEVEVEGACFFFSSVKFAAWFLRGEVLE